MSKIGRVYNETRASLPQHLARRCPDCGASAGAPCRGIYGAAIKSMHSERSNPASNPQIAKVRHG